MKPEELRIGNWVNQGGKYENRKCTAYEIYGFSRLSNSEYYKEWKPIPITEQWLLDFGFEHQNDVWFKFSAQNVFIHLSYGFDGWGLWDDEYGAVRYGINKYVHQLQNLYYALTGEELNK